MKNDRIRIGTLTFHMAHNYGAMLQAYALPTVVKKLGFQCEVIDYRFPYIDGWSRIERLDDLVAKHGRAGGMLRYAKRILTGYYWKDNMHIKFDHFERKIMPHSKRVYRDKADLDHMPYDVILFGSDQIWNSAITNGVTEEYIGGFPCFPGTRKVAYAASCGMSDFQPESKMIYDKYLEGFTAIGVREENFQKSLLSRGFDVKCVLDPTLLLTKEDWKKIIPDNNKYQNKKYLLLYAFEEDEKLYDCVREYAKERNLDIVAIAYQKKDAMHGMEVMTNCGPIEFLSLFLNAEHIITTSFHGTVFSIIFHKEFHCIPHPKFRERTDSLLTMLALKDHNINVLSRLEDVETNWEKVDTLLGHRRKESLEFLKHAIEGE